MVTRRTYNRENEDGSFETWEDTIDRVIGHQRWLWERARGRKLGVNNEKELDQLRQLFLDRKCLPAGRTLWLGGTEVSKKREASQFNCSFLKVETVDDIVDAMWLLLQGCGVGFKPVAGTLNGFTRPIPNVELIRSTRTDRGRDTNTETWDAETKTWTIGVGDSAEAWAKAFGKLVAGKRPAEKLILDFSEIRPAGVRLKGYGWISAGDVAIAAAMEAICKIMNRRAGQLLSQHDIHDICNWLGTVLSSRRSAEIVLYDYGTPGWREFAEFKKDFWIHGNDHRQQSNNSLVFWSKPTRKQLKEVFDMMVAAGGSEPGFVNGEAATRRAPWFSGLNPCAEILLSNKSFCNLVEVNLAAFGLDPSGLVKAIELVARANYRQTCVDLRDGVLQDTWHQNNDFLRLCGVGLTGIASVPNLTPYELRQLRNAAITGAYSMADELGMPRPKNVTTIKPSGTLSKIMDTTEGAHKPLGRYIFNNIKLSSHDPLVKQLLDAGYKVVQSPTATDVDTMLATLPVQFDTVEFENVDGLEVNLETAVTQLNRYKLLMDNYVDQNASITVSYGLDEVEEIVDWVHANWDSYVGVSFLFRADPTKTAADLGYPYLPQEVVTKEVYDAYVAQLKPLVIEGGDMLETDECAGGVCPVR
jgi:adenosylcobalamin-dependent ribonucleoside-triphosphate reductase